MGNDEREREFDPSEGTKENPLQMNDSMTVEGIRLALKSFLGEPSEPEKILNSALGKSPAFRSIGETLYFTWKDRTFSVNTNTMRFSVLGEQPADVTLLVRAFNAMKPRSRPPEGEL